MFCPRCGSRIPDGAKFCASCGTQLGERAAAPVPAPAPKPRRRRAPVVAAAIALVALLAGGGVAAWWFLLRPDPVYVCAKSEYVAEMPPDAETYLAAVYIPVAFDGTIIAPGLDSGLIMWGECRELEYSERGARTSSSVWDFFTDSEGAPSETCDYELDAYGNALSCPGRDESLDIQYDDRQRPIAMTRSDGLRVTYSYGLDGSHSYEMVYAGGTVERTEFDASGKAISCVKSSDGASGTTVEMSYEDGFLADATRLDAGGAVVGRVTGTQRRDERGRVVEVTLSASGDTSDILLGLAYYDRVCFEYDENGNISRYYVPWKSPDTWQIFSSGDSFGAMGEEAAFDCRFEYERVDNPTSLVRVLGDDILLS